MLPPCFPHDFEVPKSMFPLASLTLPEQRGNSFPPFLMHDTPVVDMLTNIYLWAWEPNAYAGILRKMCT